MDLKTVTLIVPCHNDKKGLKKTIDSLLGQTYNGIFITIIDNNSVDGTIQLANKYARLYPDKIQFVKNPHTLSNLLLFYQCCRLAQRDFTGVFATSVFYSPRLIEDQILSFNIYGDMGALASFGQKLVDNEKTSAILCPSEFHGRAISLVEKNQLLSLCLKYGDFIWHSTLLVKSNFYKNYLDYSGPLVRQLAVGNEIKYESHCSKSDTEVKQLLVNIDKNSSSDTDIYFHLDFALFMVSQSKMGFLSSNYCLADSSSTEYKYFVDKVRTSRHKIFYFFDSYLSPRDQLQLSQRDLENYRFLIFTDLVYRVTNMIKQRQWITIPKLNPFNLNIVASALRSKISLETYLKALWLFSFLTIRARSLGIKSILFDSRPVYRDPLSKAKSYLSADLLKFTTKSNSSLKPKEIVNSRSIHVNSKIARLEKVALTDFSATNIVIVAPVISVENCSFIKSLISPYLDHPKKIALVTSIKKSPQSFQNFLNNHPQFNRQIIDLKPFPMGLINSIKAVFLLSQAKSAAILGFGISGGLFTKFLCLYPIRVSLLGSPNQIPSLAKFPFLDKFIKNINAQFEKAFDYPVVKPAYEGKIVISPYRFSGSLTTDSMSASCELAAPNVIKEKTALKEGRELQ